MKLRVMLLIVGILFTGLAGVTATGMNQQKQAGARLSAIQLSDTEIANILYMRQEEKLAHDVYFVLYEKWGVPIFANICESEQRHMDAIKSLIEFYNLEDPIVDNSIGSFADSEFTVLFEDLTDTETESLIDAYNAGVLIEEMDIADLNEKIGQTKARNVLRVFENLLAGSENHLAAFQSQVDNYDTQSQQTCVNSGTFIQARNRDGSCLN